MVAKLYTVVFIAATTFVSCMGNDNKVVIDESLVVPASANKAAADSAAPQAITLQPGASASSAATVPSTNNVTLAPQNIATAATAQPIAAGMIALHCCHWPVEYCRSLFSGNGSEHLILL